MFSPYLVLKGFSRPGCSHELIGGNLVLQKAWLNRYTVLLLGIP